MNLCFYNFDGKIITQEDDAYEQARQEWNRAIQKYPIAIVYCKTKLDVKEAIIWAKQCEVEIRIRTGGHNYEGYSVGNRVIVIDVSEMKEIQINEKEEWLTIEAGVKNKELYDFVASRGYPFPGGTCPTVGVSGYCLGGGWGLSSRYLGLGCDSLIEIELVDDQGCLIVANEKYHADLFWACCGAGGGNFGVIVSMTFRLPQKVNGVTIFEIYCPKASLIAQKQFLETWQNWIPTIDEKINMQGGIYNTFDNGIFIYGRGFCYASVAETQKLLVPFSEIPDMHIEAKYKSFLEAIREVQAGYPAYEHFKSSGRFMYNMMSSETIEELIKIVNGPRPQNSITISIGVYGLGGQVKSKNPQETAFYYRKSNYILNMQTVWEDNLYRTENINWFNKQFELIYHITQGSYINFPDIELKDYEWEYFGENKWYLQQIKAKYDPYDIFQFPQSIR